MVTLNNILEAKSRISGYLKRTPLVKAYVSGFEDTDIFLKLETVHRTGSFKERGALNKLLHMKEFAPAAEIVATSAGNHSQSLAYHAQRLGVAVNIVMPKHTPSTKVQATARWGAKIRLTGENFAEALEIGHTLSKDTGFPFVSAYDDVQIISGQGTCGLEIVHDYPEAKTIIVPIGGGGLASAIAIAVKEQNPHCKVIGVQAEVCPYVAHAIKGEKIELPKGHCPTIAEGIAVKSLGEITIPLLRKYLDDVVLVSEQEIAMAMFYLMEHHKVVAEGAGAAGYAALLSRKIPNVSNAVILIGGGNADMTMLSRIIKKAQLKSGRLAMLNILISDRPGGLAALTQIIAKKQASILQIHHERASIHVPLFETTVDVTLETKGPEHVNDLIQELHTAGYRVNVKQ